MTRLCGIILLLLPALLLAQGENMIPNPGFEDGDTRPDGWFLGREGIGAGSATWVTDNPHSGKRCVRLELTESGNYWMAQQRYEKGTAKPNHAYRISGWYRGDKSGCHPCVYSRGADGQFLGAWESSLPGTDEWRPFEFVFTSKPGTDHLELQLRWQGEPGVCWLDDVRLEDSEALMKQGEEMAASLLSLAETKPEYLWTLVGNGGQAEFELAGDKPVEIAWVVAGPNPTGSARGASILHAGNPGSADAWETLLVPRALNTELQTRIAVAPAGKDTRTQAIRAICEANGPQPMLLLGIRADANVSTSLARVETSQLAWSTGATSLPWQTRVLDVSRERIAQIRSANRNEILRRVLGAEGTQAAAAVCGPWTNYTEDQWLQWARTAPEDAPTPLGFRNEYVSLQALYAPPGQPTQVRATLSDLAADSGAKIPASASQVRLVEYVPFGDKLLPDPLLEGETFAPSKLGPIVFWLTIHVPEDARPGVYRGQLTMQADDGPATQRDVSVRVCDVTLPDETHLQSSFWLFRAQINRYFGLDGDVPMEDYFPYIDLATSHRLSPVDVVEGPTEPMVKIFREADGRLSYDFSYWDRYLDRLKLGGANTIHLGFTHWMAHYFTKDTPKIIDKQTGETVVLGYEYASEEHLDELARYLRAAADHLKERGEFEKCYIQPWDEPYGDGLKNSHAVLEGLKERVPDIPRLMDAIYPDAYEGKMNDVVNLWCPISPQVGQGAFDEVRERGDTMWWYVCCGPRKPYANLFTNWTAAEMRVWFWQSWQHEITGVLYWGLNYWLGWGDPVPGEDKRFPNGPWVSSTTSVQSDYMGDGYFIYPGPSVDKPLSSIRLETIRDGIEDYDLLYLLNSEVEKAQNADPETLKLAREVLAVRPQVSKSLIEFDRDGAAMDSEREVVAELISKLQRP